MLILLFKLFAYHDELRRGHVLWTNSPAFICPANEYIVLPQQAQREKHFPHMT